MAEQWIIRVHGKEYGPADLPTLEEWKSEGRVLPTNPARQVDFENWKTAGEIPGLFRSALPPVQSTAEARVPRAIATDTAATTVISRPPARNVLVETFRIYFRGFFQFLGLSLLGIVPILCAEFTSRFIDTASAANVDLRTLVAWAFGMCMLTLRIVLIPVYVAGIQILTAELATGQRIGFFSVLNGAVKYWPRIAGLGLFVWGVFFLLFVFAFGIAVMVVTSATLVSVVIALGLLAIQVWLFTRFFINVLFWQQFAVLENLNAIDSLRESRNLARSGQDLPWYQRPMWRGGFIVSLWYAFVIALSLTVLWPTLQAQWPIVQDYLNQLTRATDPQAVLQKLNASLQASQASHGFDYRALALNIGERILQPLLGIAFVVLYLDSRREGEG
jgi:GYF domain 2